MVPELSKRYVKHGCFWPSRQVRPSACKSVAGFLPSHADTHKIATTLVHCS